MIVSPRQLVLRPTARINEVYHQLVQMSKLEMDLRQVGTRLLVHVLQAEANFGSCYRHDLDLDSFISLDHLCCRIDARASEIGDVDQA
jgi:hypothetical protein